MNFLSIWSFTTRSKPCKTTNESGSAKKDVACHFPFILQDKTYDACTNESDPDNRFWCSTKVDRSEKHVEGNWGYCSEDCFSSTNEEAEKPKCLTTDEPDSQVKNAPCLFPWNLNGETYDSCTTVDDPEGRFWCATKLDESGSYVDGQWGYCPETAECTSNEVDESIPSDSGLWMPSDPIDDGCGQYLGMNINIYAR